MSRILNLKIKFLITLLLAINVSNCFYIYEDLESSNSNEETQENKRTLKPSLFDEEQKDLCIKLLINVLEVSLNRIVNIEGNNPSNKICLNFFKDYFLKKKKIYSQKSPISTNRKYNPFKWG
jgi:hypothetical protein